MFRFPTGNPEKRYVLRGYSWDTDLATYRDLDTGHRYTSDGGALVVIKE